MPAQFVMPAAVRTWGPHDQGESLLVMLFPYLAGLRVLRAEDTGDAVVVYASGGTGGPYRQQDHSVESDLSSGTEDVRLGKLVAD